ncbi:unnamed protein product, partial [marine sediment metagenome]
LAPGLPAIARWAYRKEAAFMNGIIITGEV